jgi:uncharacterized membrane protein
LAAGKTVGQRKTAVLPDRCVKSNVPTSRKLKRKLNWHHPAIFLSILISLCIYIILAMIFSKKATIHIGLSDEWFAKRVRAIMIGWGSVLSSIAIIVIGIVLVDKNDAFAILILVGVLEFLVGAIYGMVASRMVSPSRIDDTFVWLKGVNTEYLDELPVWPG